MIGEIVTVTVDRPLGSAHPDYPEMIYPLNYGYIEGIMAHGQNHCNRPPRG